MFRTLSTDGIDQEMLFNEENKINCIDQSGCLGNEICVKHGDTDVGICQCPLGFKRNIAGTCDILFIHHAIRQNESLQIF